MKTVGSALKRRRETLGLTQEEVAEEFFDVTRQAYRLWELDAQGPSMNMNLDRLGEIAKFLGTDKLGALIEIGWIDDGTASVSDAPRQTIRAVRATQNGDELAARRAAKKATASVRHVDFHAAA